MSFDNATNRGRAEKMVEILGLVQKSRLSNRASAGEIAELLAPVRDKLREIGALDATEAPTPPPTAEAPEGRAEAPERAPEPQPLDDTPGGRWAADQNAPAWAIIRDAAARAPLSDLTAAFALMGTRVDEALAQIAQAKL